MNLKKTAVIAFIIMIISSFAAVYAAEEKCGEDMTCSYSGGTLYIRGRGEMYNYEKNAVKPWSGEDIKRIEIDEGVSSVGDWAFWGMEELGEVKLSSSVRRIGERAFYSCSKLSYIDIPKGVDEIKAGAFCACVGARRISLPKTLREIGNSAFMDIPGVRVITIPENVEKIGKYAFFGCAELQALYFEGKTPESIGSFALADISEDFVVYFPDIFIDSWYGFDKISPDHLAPYVRAARIPVYLNNREIPFDQQPVITDGRTLVPLRAIFEAMGAEVSWDGSNSTVSAKRGDIVISLKIGEKVMYKNSSPITLDVAARIEGDRTLVPLRAVSEAFGAGVEWDNDERAVYIEL